MQKARKHKDTHTHTYTPAYICIITHTSAPIDIKHTPEYISTCIDTLVQKSHPKYWTIYVGICVCQFSYIQITGGVRLCCCRTQY